MTPDQGGGVTRTRHLPEVVVLLAEYQDVVTYDSYIIVLLLVFLVLLWGPRRRSPVVATSMEISPMPQRNYVLRFRNTQGNVTPVPAGTFSWSSTDPDVTLLTTSGGIRAQATRATPGTSTIRAEFTPDGSVPDQGPLVAELEVTFELGETVAVSMEIVNDTI